MLDSIYDVIYDEEERSKFLGELAAMVLLLAAAYGSIILLALAITRGWL